MPENDSTILKTALHNFERAATRLNLKYSQVMRLIDSKEKIEFSLNPTFPCGKSMYIKAFVCRHNDALGPSKGGIRMTPNVTCDDILGLSMEMTWKTALIGVPFGGGKSGICFDSKDLSSDEKEGVLWKYILTTKRKN